jgi:hypothetical protein
MGSGTSEAAINWFYSSIHIQHWSAESMHVFKHGLDLNVDISFLPKYKYFCATAINAYTVKFFAYGRLPPNFPPPAEQLGQPAAAGFQPAASAASAGRAGTLQINAGRGYQGKLGFEPVSVCNRARLPRSVVCSYQPEHSHRLQVYDMQRSKVSRFKFVVTDRVPLHPHSDAFINLLTSTKKTSIQDLTNVISKQRKANAGGHHWRFWRRRRERRSGDWLLSGLERLVRGRGAPSPVAQSSSVVVGSS